MLIAGAYQKNGQNQYKKISLTRVPIRLGASVFSEGKIDKESVARLIDAMQAFGLLCKVYGATQVLAYATSAFREASNGKEVIKEVAAKAGIDIKIINGKREAEIIYHNHVAELIDDDAKCLYVDVGGGSTELTLFVNRKRVDSKSFKIGTVRMMQHGIDPETRSELKTWVKKARDQHQPNLLIGTGGSINKYYALTRGRKKNNKRLVYGELVYLHKKLAGLTVDERIIEFNLNPDRADTIVHAGEIFKDIMKWSKIDEIYVPKLGVSDGMVKEMYEKITKPTSNEA